MNLSLSDFISHELFEKIKIYEAILKKWNAGMALVQKDTLSDFYYRHVLDSLQVLPLLNRRVIADSSFHHNGLLDILVNCKPFADYVSLLPSQSIVDVGSGAGFPGMVLAICGVPNIVLCESNSKKCLFLEEVARQTSTQVCIENVRAEKLHQKFDVILSRACTNLSNLLLIASHLSSNADTFAIFHKGKTWKDEVAHAHQSWFFNYTAFSSVVSLDEAVLLLIKNISASS